VAEIAAHLRSELRHIGGVTVHLQGAQQCGLVTFSVAGRSTGEVKQRLAESKINVSTLSRESAQYDFTGRNLPDLVRASVHYFNTEDEVQRLAKEIDHL
jgi:selenocysteine lyase/cysteine desulfurase